MGDKKVGKVFLIGAGPGDPGLLTLKGKQCLEQSQVIIYDYLSSPALLKYASAGTELIAADFRGKKFSDGSIMNQDLLNKLIVDRAKKGKIVSRLKGGDPFIFGRGGEEAEVLVTNKIPFEVVPGVSAAQGLAYAGFPLTHRKYASSVCFVTGHEDPNKPGSSVDWDQLPRTGTLVFYMGVENLAKIVHKLIAHRRRATPVALIEWVTRGRQREVFGTLKDIVKKTKQAGIKAPALIVVGEVIALRKKLNWRKTLPLAGQTILVTRSREQASRLTDKLTALGAEIIEFPTIEIAPPESYAPLDKAIAAIHDFQFLVFTSVNGVRFFFDRLAVHKLDTRALHGLKIAGIGPGTIAELKNKGILAEARANCDYTQEGLVEDLLRLGVKGRNILIPRAEKAREVLSTELREAGARVEVVTAYRTVRPDWKPAAQKETAHLSTRFPFQQRIDWITFTSSSTVENFVEIFGRQKSKQLLKNVKVASIGRITSATVKNLGLKVAAEAKSSTIDGLVEAIVKA